MTSSAEYESFTSFQCPKCIPTINVKGSFGIKLDAHFKEKQNSGHESEYDSMTSCLLALSSPQSEMW